MIKVMPIE